jgi:hypothetical protein
MAQASTGGEEGAPQAPALPSSHIFYPSSSCSSCCCACTCGVQVPFLLPSSLLPSSPPPPLPSFPTPLLDLPSSPLSPLLVVSVSFTRSSLRSTCLLSLCSRLRRDNSLSFLPPLSPTFSFYFSLFFPSPSPHATCNARRLSNVLGRALCVATRCAFLFFLQKKEKKLQAHKARALCALLT